MIDRSGDTPPKKGRGFPPKEHQFRPGQSGNYAGRPPGAKNRARQAALIAGLTAGDLAVIDEAHRAVMSTDGKRLSTINAIHRARNIGAMKGNRFMAKDADVRLRQAEEKVAFDKRDQFEKAFELQALAELIIDHSKTQVVGGHGVYPHPDDIHLDHATLAVRVEGPMSATENREWNQLLTELAHVRRQVLRYRRRVEKEPHRDELQYMLLRATECFTAVNRMFPERYRLRRLPLWVSGRDIPLPECWRLAM